MICDPILEKVVKGELVYWHLNSFKLWCLKGHGHAILVHFKNQKYVLTSMNAHK